MKDSIRFTYSKNVLNIITRQSDYEKHSFYIVKEEEVIINNVTHTVLTSDQNDIFHIVNDKFHREDDKPAIICRRFDLNYTDSDGEQWCLPQKNSQLFWCKMWFKNGLYHRENDKPALIWDNGDLMWMIKGHFKRNPFEHMSIYVNSNNVGVSFDRSDKNSDFVFHNKEEIKRQQAKGLIAYNYNNCG